MNQRLPRLVAITSDWDEITESPVVGKDVLELLSSSMYVNALSIYREYVQNSVDAIEEAIGVGLLGDRYAEVFAERFRGVRGHPYEQGFDLRLVPEKLLEPLRWPKPKMVFVNSMSDLFHEKVPCEYVRAVAKVMCESPWHIYQVLTKRAARLQEMLSSELAEAGRKQHIWWGVSVENRKHGLPRLEQLTKSAAAVRFVSIEPLLEDLGEVDFTGINWVIVGGESGRGARIVKREWVLSLLRQCEAARVPFFFKQWGGTLKHASGRVLDGKTYDQFPPCVRALPPDRKTREVIIARLQNEFTETRLSQSVLA